MKIRVRRKWRDDVLKEGFVPFPKTLLRTMEQLFQGKDAIGLLTTVMSIVDFKGSTSKTSGPSIEYLSFIGDVEPSETSRRLQILKRDGFIDWDEIDLDDRKILVFDLKGLYDKISKVGNFSSSIDHGDIPF